MLDDNDISATHRSKKKRPQYAEALSMLEHDQADLIVCFNLDRLWRQPKELEYALDLVDTLTKQGRARFSADGNPCLIATLNGFMDLSSPQGRMIARVLVMVGAMEADLISQRVSAQKRQRRERGLPMTAMGFGWTTPTEQNKTEADWVKDIGDRVLAGHSIRSIAVWLTESKVPLKRGKGSTEWHSTTVRSMMRSPHNAGLMAHDGELVRGTWKPIFTEAKWRRIQAELDRRGSRNVTPRRTSLLGGLVHCAVCGAPMVISSSARSRNLNCPTRSNAPGTKRCTGVSMNAAVLEEWVTDYVLHWADRDDVARMANKGKERAADADIARVTRQLAAKQKEHEQVCNDIADGKVPYSSGKKIAARMEDGINNMEAELNRLFASANGQTSEYLNKPGLLRKHWDQLTIQEQRTAISSVFALTGTRVTIAKSTAHSGGKQPVNMERIKVVPV
jgi:DNA invertase Pin-like site-specific DNA recombinase